MTTDKPRTADTGQGSAPTAPDANTRSNIATTRGGDARGGDSTLAAQRTRERAEMAKNGGTGESAKNDTGRGSDSTLTAQRTHERAGTRKQGELAESIQSHTGNSSNELNGTSARHRDHLPSTTSQADKNTAPSATRHAETKDSEFLANAGATKSKTSLENSSATEKDDKPQKSDSGPRADHPRHPLTQYEQRPPDHLMPADGSAQPTSATGNPVNAEHRYNTPGPARAQRADAPTTSEGQTRVDARPAPVPSNTAQPDVRYGTTPKELPKLPTDKNSDTMRVSSGGDIGTNGEPATNRTEASSRRPSTPQDTDIPGRTRTKNDQVTDKAPSDTNEQSPLTKDDQGGKDSSVASAAAADSDSTNREGWRDRLRNPVPGSTDGGPGQWKNAGEGEGRKNDGSLMWHREFQERRTGVDGKWAYAVPYSRAARGEVKFDGYHSSDNPHLLDAKTGYARGLRQIEEAGWPDQWQDAFDLDDRDQKTQFNMIDSLRGSIDKQYEALQESGTDLKSYQVFDRATTVPLVEQFQNLYLPQTVDRIVPVSEEQYERVKLGDTH
jgi:hypothetical protein